MKYLNILVTIILLACSYLYSEEIHTYEEVLVHTFGVGDGLNDIGYHPNSPYENKPSCFLFDGKKLIIGDVVNNRLIFFNENLNHFMSSNSNILWSLKLESGNDNLLFGSILSEKIYIFNKQNHTSNEIKINSNISSGRNTVIFTSKIIFLYLYNNSLVSFILEDQETLKYSNMLNTEETRQLFNDKKKYGLEEYSLDHKDRVFKNGKIQNVDYRNLYDYWTELQKRDNITPNHNIPGLRSFKKLKRFSSKYIGKDIDGNTYWSSYEYVNVFNQFGVPIDFIEIKNYPILVSSDKVGNIFFISEGKLEGELVLNLYKIQRRW